MIPIDIFSVAIGSHEQLIHLLNYRFFSVAFTMTTIKPVRRL